MRRLAVRPGFLGLLGTVLVHGLLLQSFVLGAAARKVRIPEVQGPGASAQSGGAEADSTLILLQPIDAVNREPDIQQEIASRGLQAKDLSISIVSPDQTPAYTKIADAIDDQAADAPVTAGDPTGRARFFGIYTGQIQARITRIWRRPRTLVNESRAGLAAGAEDETFQCQATIVQDGKGNVQEVLLPHCNGSFAWQRSLVMAIQQASPLPAPPDPTVFSKSVTLNFVGFSYTAGAPAEDYELVARDALQASESTSPPR